MSQDCSISQSSQDNLERIKKLWNTNHSNSKTAHNSTCEKHSRVLSAGLQARSDRENNDSNQHGVFSRDLVGKPTIEQRTGPSSEFESRHEPTLDSRSSQGRKVSLEILHDEDGAHNTLVITVHHTSERCETTCHEDVWVLQHANNAMLLVGIVATNNGLRLGRIVCFDSHNGEGGWVMFSSKSARTSRLLALTVLRSWRSGRD